MGHAHLERLLLIATPRQFGGARVVLRSLAGSGCSPKTYALNPGVARGQHEVLEPGRPGTGEPAL